MRHSLLLLCLLALALPARAEDLVYYPRDAENGPNGNPRLVVPDPDAHGGTAQAAVPGTSKAGSYTCALYSYARPSARYRVTWRLKLDDNAIPDVVVKVWTSDEQGRTGFKGGGLEIKGTDFAAPGKYQDFAYDAEKAEGGFFNVGALWQGKGRLHVDSIRISPTTVFTEREMLERQGKVSLPEAWTIRRPTPPVMHLGKGLWWNVFGLSEAMAEVGGATWTSSYHTSGQYGMQLRGFPATWQEYFGYNLIVLTNVDAQALGPYGRLLLEEYVKNGGALLVNGGPFALERGGYRGTALERLLPCELKGDDRAKLEGDNVLKPGDGAATVLPKDLSWSLQPRAFYLHPVAPKPGATVLVSAGGKPVVIAWTCGKGRVAVVAATAEGLPAADQLAFWEWGDWPRLMAGLMRWLTTGQGEQAVPADSAATKKLLDDLLAPSTGEDSPRREGEINTLLALCHDAAFARNLVESVSAFEGTPDRTLVTAILLAVRPFVSADFAKPATALVDSGNPGKADLGLRLLGMCKTPDAAAVILKFLDRGAAALKTAGGGGDEVKLDDLVNQARSGGIGDDQRLQLAAVMALGDLGDAAHLAPLRALKLPPAGKTTVDGELGEITDLNENLVQQVLATRVRLGDGAAVGPLFDEVTANIDKIVNYTNYMDVMLMNNDDKELLRGRKVAVVRLPILRQRQALCRDVLRQFPASVYPAVAAELAKRDDERLAPFIYAALSGGAGKALAPATAVAFLPAVAKCRPPELRLLAFNLVANGSDAETQGKLAGVLTELAAADDRAGAVFAVRQVARLAPDRRAAVLAAALKHRDAQVQHLARASLLLLSDAERKTLAPTK